MQISDLNWGWFVAVCLSIGVLRLLFRQFLPLKLLSVTTAATIGFGFFLALPILGYSNNLTIPVHEYSLFVCLAYLSFLIGASVARRLFVERRKLEIPTPDPIQTHIATAFCLIWLAILLGEFFSRGGFAHMWEVIFGGWAHLQVLSQIEASMQSNQGMSFQDIGTVLLNNIFCCLWVVLYIKMPKRALAFWAVYILTNLGDYISRSTLLGLILLPFFTYVLLNRPSGKRLAILSGILLLMSLVFFSWNSSVRLGLNSDLSPRQVFLDTMRDAGSSAVPATAILSQNIRGNPKNYFMALATFLIPRSIWSDKPNEQYNYEMTYQLTGLIIGQGTSVITSTMLGEAWYYFGWSGTIWLMLMFGFCAYCFEHLLTKNIYLLGLFVQIFYITAIYIRSTFLTYYQAGIIAVAAAITVNAVFVVLRSEKGISNLPQVQVRYP